MSRLIKQGGLIFLLLSVGCNSETYKNGSWWGMPIIGDEILNDTLDLEQAFSSYQAELSYISTVHIQGMPSQIYKSPEGLKAAYLFSKDKLTRVRIDIPQSEFGDQKARVFLHDLKSQKSRVLYKDSEKIDESFDLKSIQHLIKHQDQMAVPIISESNIYQQQTVGRFSQKAEKMGMSIMSAQNKQQKMSTYTKEINDSDKKLSQQVVFDHDAGLIRSASSTYTTSLVKRESETSIQYVALNKDKSLFLPLKLSTQIETRATGSHLPVKGNIDIQYKNPKTNKVPVSAFHLGDF